MSRINIAQVSAPPFFPAEGRLPGSFDQVQANVNLQTHEEKEFKLKLNESNGLTNTPPCCKSLHISLFFDGTNNNEKASMAAARPNPSNIARLYHAALEDNDSGYYRYYMPGVGTAFPEIGELDFSDNGLRFATGGEGRINWALLRIVDAVSHTLTGDGLDDSLAKEKVFILERNLKGTVASKKTKRQDTFRDLFAPLRAKAKTLQPKILKIKLFVYGFSRGAAEARAFVNWLTHILDGELLKEKTSQPNLLGWPIAVEFLGLCDTVASVGIARVAPGFRGHMAWADNNLALPDENKYPGFVRHCCHFVSAHEQRLCFPLDSVRRTEGHYPKETCEVVYPGVHSDVGGGYMREEQGKGVENGLILSQIVLHDLYAAAFVVGAPLSAPANFVPPGLLSRKPSRVMEGDVLKEFDIQQPLVERFNAWRNTLQANLPQTPTPGYQPVTLAHGLESVIEQQIAWMTAWRIGRFVNGSYLRQAFYQAANWNSGDSDPARLSESEKKRKEAQDAREEMRKKILDTPGVPIFEPALDQQQLREGANEFRADYQSLLPFIVGMTRDNTGGVLQVLVEGVGGKVMYILDPDDQAAEYTQMKKAGNALTGKLFKDARGTVTDDHHYALICSLYDDHIHDSRAWFMHSTLGFRELWAGYFRYRTIYSEDYCNKGTTLLKMQQKSGELVIGVHVYAALEMGKTATETDRQLGNLGTAIKKGMEISAQASLMEAEITAARNKRIIDTVTVTLNKAMELSAEANKLEIEAAAARNEKIRRLGETVIHGVVDKIKQLPTVETCRVADTDGRTICHVPMYGYMVSPVLNISQLREIYHQQEAAKDKQQRDALARSLNNSAEASHQYGGNRECVH